MAGALLTDLYELTMAASYLRRDMRERATFSLYVRTQPPERGFLIAAGLEACLEFLEELRFEEHELSFLHDALGFGDDAIDAFRSLRFDGEVWAIPEGRVVVGGEPILEVTAPIAIAQLVETYLLNTITTHTILASKAARYRIAAPDRELVDFAFRRTHGVNAAIAVARASAMVGFSATSNVEAARLLGLRATGTMAHSYIESFPTEADAFRAYATDIPGRATFLVDTYDTLGGVRTAVEVIRELGLTEHLAVRLDSGDLDALSRGAREILDEAGLPEVRIIASGGLDEHEVRRLVLGGAPIDVYGIGTQMGVSVDAPSLDSVYKLVQYGERPVVKLSAAKATMPGPKQVFRGTAGDVIGLRDEPAPAGTVPVLEPVMRAGVRNRPAPSFGEMRARFEADLASLPDEARALTAPQAPRPTISDRLRLLTDEVRGQARSRLAGHEAPSP